MLDNFREWLSDNLRYILLGLAGILILVIAFFAIRLVSGLGSSKKNTPETQQTTEKVTEAQTENRTESKLVRDQADVLEVAKQYYTARANKDYDTLASLSEVFDDAAREYLEKQDAAVESYSNIMTYSKPGLTEGSYVVYVYFDAKLTGINTVAPSLRELYFITNADGKLVVADQDNSAEQKAYIQSLRTDSDVQALIADVDQKLEDAKAQDAELKEFVEKSLSANADQNGDGQNNAGDTGDGEGGTTVGTATGTMQANDGVNVRSIASTDGTIYGTLAAGMTVEVIENLDNGWSKIQYIDGSGNTVEGYVMSQYLSAAQ